MTKDDLLELLLKSKNALQWYIENDEVNEGDIPLEQFGGQTWDELNAFWIKGKHTAKEVVKEIETILFMKEEK